MQNAYSSKLGSIGTLTLVSIGLSFAYGLVPVEISALRLLLAGVQLFVMAGALGLAFELVLRDF
jgi:hypothetical protein